MSAGPASPPAPRENEELLRLAANLRGVPQQEDPRRFSEISRDLVLALERHRVILLEGDEGAPARIDGPDGRLLVAFTDEEARGAWEARRHPADPRTGRCSVFPGSEPATGRTAGRVWTALFAETGAELLVVNPVGPWSFIVGRAEFGGRPRLRRREPAAEGEPFLDVAERAAERTRDRALVDALAAAVEARDETEIDRLRPELWTSNRLGDARLGLEDQLLAGRLELARGDVAVGAQGLAFGAIGLGRYGDVPGAIDALLLVADLLSPLLRDGIEVDGPSLERVRHHAARVGHALQAIATSYRADEALDACTRLP